MLKRDGNYPRWSAPFIGMIAGAGIALKVGEDIGEGFSPTVLVGGLIAGGLAGGLIFLIDVKPAEDKSLSRQGRYGEPGDTQGDPGTLMSRFFAVLSPLLCFVPVLNLLWSVSAFFMNRRVYGWPKTVSKIGLVLSVLFSVLILILLAQN
jgi:hypothetical protein